MKRLISILLFLSAADAGAADATPDPVFRIGTPDGAATEFKLGSGLGWQKYAQKVTAPVVFAVGRSKPSDWPYIHPNTRDSWAGSKTHPFTIRFQLAKAPDAPLKLVIGQVNSWENPEVAATVNGFEVGRRRAPAGTGDAGSGKAEQEGRPDATVFDVPAAALKAGANEIVITLFDGSWILYDYVQLGAGGPPPRVKPPGADAVVANLKSGAYGAFDEFVFATRTLFHGDGHWYANIGYYSYDTNICLAGSGGRLCAWNFKTGALRLLVDDPEGGVRDPVVSYDGAKILFSYRPAGTQNFHLHEIGVDGKGLKRLTDGGFDDIEPCYLPDGGIAFVSTRSRRWVNCWLTQVATIHRCDADGGNIRLLSSNIEHDNTPWVLPDGRLIYMRWEYVDRSQVNYHHLWTMNPDGTSHSVYFGNYHPSGLYIDAKPVPGGDGVVFIDSPGHGQIEHMGRVAVVSPDRGPDTKDSLRAVSRGNNFRDPWAFAPDAFVAARDRQLVALDGKGRETVLFALPTNFAGALLHEPRPVVARAREPLLPDQTNWKRATGRFLLDNVYYGRNMAGVTNGAIRKLMVLESLPKPVNFTGGMDPLSYVGTFTLPRVLGTVPVEADGSAYFEAPALRPLFFVALDANDRAVKRMQSFTQVMPGETLGCVGCHEHRTTTRSGAPAAMPLAARRAPATLQPIPGGFDVADFPRDVQPVLDRNCVRCHNPEERKGGVILSGDRGPMFSHGYYTLAAWRQVADGRNYARSGYGPYELGSGGSALMKKFDGSHHDVKPAAADARTVALWLDASAPYPGTYAALGTGMIGGYQMNQQVLENDGKWPTTVAAAAAFDKRCASCHKGPAILPRSLSDEIGLSFWSPSMDDPRLKRSRHIVFNLTRPEKSVYLLAPLAKAAGGYGLCRAKDAPAEAPGGLFATTDDPDYRALFAMIDAGRARLEQVKRFDMPGFRPRPEYLREMIRFGVLPASFDIEKDPVDAYALDRAYWALFEYKP